MLQSSRLAIWDLDYESFLDPGGQPSDEREANPNPLRRPRERVSAFQGEPPLSYQNEAAMHGQRWDEAENLHAFLLIGLPRPNPHNGGWSGSFQPPRTCKTHGV